MITKYDNLCAICGRPAECTHHLIFGVGLRNLADEDHIFIRMCNKCHNFGRQAESIHGNPMAEYLSKMLGQAMWELNQIASEDQKEEVREAFRKRYGRSYL